MLSDDAIALMEAATDGVIVIDHTGRIAAANRAAGQLMGFEQADLVGKNIDRLLATSLGTIIGRDREVFTLRRDGMTFPASLSVGRIAGSDPPRYVGFLREAETHGIQARLMSVSRMASMGEMAAGVAHEINQPLTAISNYAHACERFIAANPPALEDIRDCVQEIVDEARRAADIVLQLRRLVRQNHAERTIAACNDIVLQVQPLLQADARTHDCRLELKFGEQLPNVLVDAVQLQQVLLNLVRNAVEALESIPVGQRRVSIATRAVGTEAVEITVQDNGPGVAPEMLDCLFEPFSTTKPTGTGLGLPIGRTIVQAHGGSLTHDRHPGTGACFRIQIPAMEKSLT